MSSSSLSIKTMTISGFRSFRSTAEIEPFSPRHNAVVGRNGSGKSNFFDAVEFVLLSQRFYSLRQDERQRLLHDSAGANVMSAYVEIVFDNSEGRMPVDGAEVTLRRALGVKKDEFFVNGRRQSRKEVEGILESAGFSRANPYYIVQQGKVNALCLMKDDERLLLLKNVGGAGVYEDRRKESVQLMKETEAKRDKIAGVVGAIEDRLGELEGEKEELQHYERLDREHRALTFSLYDQELQKARTQLDDLEASRETDSAAAAAAYDERARVEGEKRDAEAAQRASAEQVGRAREDAAALEAARSERLNLAAKARTELAEQRARLDAEGRREVRLKRRLRSVVKQMRTARSALAMNTERRKRAEEAVASSGLDDEWLEADLGEVEAAVEEKRAALSRGLAALAAAERRKAELVGRVAERHGEAARLEREATALLGEDRPAEDVLQVAAAAAGAEVEAVERESLEAAEAVARCEQQLRALMPPPVARGLASLERALKADAAARAKHHGTVLEHVSLVNEKYRTAVEVAAGNQLWHVVVDDDAAAAASVRRLERQGGGRLTFIPVNRIRARAGAGGDSATDIIPAEAEAEVAPLADVALRLPDEAVAPVPRAALESVFARKLLARSNEAASRYSKALRRDCVTLDGDQTSKRGATEGGYRAPTDSALGALAHLRAAKAHQAAFDGRRTRALDAKRDAKAALDAAEAVAARARAERDHLRKLATLARRDHDALAAEGRQADAAIRRYHKTLADLRLALTALEADAAKKRRASGATQLSPEDLEELKRQRTEARTELALAEAEAATLEAALRDDLSKERDEIRGRLGLVAVFGEDEGDDVVAVEGDEEEEEEEEEEEDILIAEAEDDEEASSERRERIAKVEAELSALEGALEADDAQLAALERAVREAEAARVREQARLDEASSAAGAAAERVDAAAKAAERHVARRQVLVQRREETMRKLRHVGTLPEREVREFKQAPIKELIAHIDRNNRARAKLEHVNKKALDQYVNFADQRATLLDRKAELDKAAAAIEDLVANLDAKKDEAIERTYKGCNRHFGEIFRELVPGGTAQLVMVRKNVSSSAAHLYLMASSESSSSEGLSGTPAADDDSQQRRKRRKATDDDDAGAFEGIQVLIRFPGCAAPSSMNSLSGGQKALVALALIFAIQRLDPAPFYLFDEVDAALDANYRTAVAALIKKQANSEENPAQFITTTFRPEFVRVADAHYGISLSGKTSHVNKVDMESALAFVVDNQDETAAVPQV